MTNILQLQKYELLAFANVPTVLHGKNNKQWQIQDLRSFDSTMVALEFSTKFEKKSVLFASERDIMLSLMLPLGLPG